MEDIKKMKDEVKQLRRIITYTTTNVRNQANTTNDPEIAEVYRNVSQSIDDAVEQVNAEKRREALIAAATALIGFIFLTTIYGSVTGQPFSHLFR